MKKILSLIVLSGAALALAGCGNKGGSRDDYNTGSGGASNTYNSHGTTNNYQGGARSPDGVNTGTGSSGNNSSLKARDQSGVNNSSENGTQPNDPKRTNSVPEK